MAESLNITSANAVGTPGIKNTDPSTEPDAKDADVPDDTADNDSDDLNSRIGHCVWAVARNLPETTVRNHWRSANLSTN